MSVVINEEHLDIINGVLCKRFKKLTESNLGKDKKKHILNDDIDAELGPKAREVRVKQVILGPDGASTSSKICSLEEAKKDARDQGLDLVLISPKAETPVCEIMNYGKILYQKKKKGAEQKKKVDSQGKLKEIVIHPSTDVGDINTCVGKAKKFLAKGHSVQVTCKMKRREIVHPDAAERQVEAFIEKLVEDADPETKNAQKKGHRERFITFKPKKH